MVKRGDKLPAEFRQEWLERNRELRKTAGKLLASVIADGNILPGEPLYRALGFEVDERFTLALPDGTEVPVAGMSRPIDLPTPAGAEA